MSIIKMSEEGQFVLNVYGLKCQKIKTPLQSN